MVMPSLQGLKRLVFLGILSGISSYSSAATINATSCAQAAVQSAVNTAVDGDTVTVPAGNCSWSAEVSIFDKTILLKGAGNGLTGGTTITYGGTGHTLIDISAGTKRGLMDVSGFYFIGGDTNYWGGMAIEFNGPVGWKNLRIHHNRFNNKLWTLRGGAYTHGLVDNNIFQGSAYGMIVKGLGDTDWSTPLVLGTSDFFFVENNTFDWNDWYGSTGAPTMDMENGGRVVFRYNTVNYGMAETHDMARNGMPSANAWEIYNNTFSRPNGTNGWKGLDLSAGTGVIFGNTFNGDYSIAIGAIDYKSFDPRSVLLCDGTDPKDQNVPGQTGWRCQYQIGSQGQGPTAIGYPAYIWNNIKNGSPVGMSCTSGCQHLIDGRDFINNGTTPKQGYTPYTYPHPLAQGTTVPTNPPSTLQAPKNLRIL
ncbi:MAG: hypothetical protein ACXWQA_09805 [Pseudobdellovibrionaceae bacterium]